MDKRILAGRKLALVSFLCMMGNVSCINEISSEITEGSIPITFSAKVKDVTTKVTGTLFDKDDKIALYAVLTGNDISGQRYIDNLLLTAGEDNKLFPQRDVFYPEGEDAALDFISYYPYQQEGLSEGKTTLTVSVQADQSDKDNYLLSDFLVAGESSVKSSNDAVSLEYQHKLSKIIISLSPEEGENLDDMLAANPHIVATGFQTQALYDLKTGTFSNPGQVEDMQLYGEWKKEEGKLTGKEFIVIPQTVTGGQMLQMEWNGRIYNCSVPSLGELTGSTQYELVIKAVQNNSYLLSGVCATIENWSDGGVEEGMDNAGLYTTIHLTALTFQESNVYQVHYKGKVIAEICKEYLKSPTLDSRAIVAYPMSEENTADLAKGTVLQLLDVEKNICGGTLMWDKEANSFTYTQGSSANLETCCFDQAGTALTENTDAAVNVNVIAYTLRDTRGGTVKKYPVVKIGTQYWMRSNLEATCYHNGASLPKLTTQDGTAGYFNPTGTQIYFYSGEAVLSDDLTPAGWQIPTNAEWQVLLAYVGNEVAALKTGTWLVVSENAALAPITNMAMFNMSSDGIWNKSTHISISKIAAFWTLAEENGKQVIPEQTVFFTGEDDEVVMKDTKATDGDYYKVLSIRCIRQ